MQYTGLINITKRKVRAPATFLRPLQYHHSRIMGAAIRRGNGESTALDKATPEKNSFKSFLEHEVVVWKGETERLRQHEIPFPQLIDLKWELGFAYVVRCHDTLYMRAGMQRYYLMFVTEGIM